MQVIKAEHLSKEYKLGAAKQDSVRDSLAAIFGPRSNKSSAPILRALDDISFTVGHGETIGIIGRNGAGKSTLLKILSRITKPTSGTAEIRGRVGSLLEVGTGFHNELTGRENIYLNGAILGMKHAEIDRKFDEIVDFSEVERFLDTPVKHYSSGMYMRLAFSVAAHLDPEVLIVDEVLAVGDMMFQQKCLGKMDEFGRSGRTVLFVSHNLGSLAQICKRGLLLDGGKLIAEGGIDETINKYLSLARSQKQYSIAELDASKSMQITEAYVTNSGGDISAEIGHDEDLFLNFAVQIADRKRGAMFCVALLNKYKERVFTEHRLVEDFVSEGVDSVSLRFGIPSDFIAPNNYSFLLQIFLPTGEIIDNNIDICPITIIDTGSELAIYKDYGYVQVRSTWETIVR
ncbi:MAG: polysaccharide ABC transporter ATP-binding protein [Acidobacteriota bacterium]